MNNEIIYTMEDWHRDGVFKADPGQRITAEVYNAMRDIMPPLDMPRETARRALRVLRVPVHSGFLMGEPETHDDEGRPLYRAFASNNYGTPKYFYVGLSPREELLQGVLYLFDCMDGTLGDGPLTADQVCERITGKAGTYTEAELKTIAADYEADLYRQEYKAGRLVNEKKLYNAWGMFDQAAPADQGNG